jgi:hypothetical protein
MNCVFCGKETGTEKRWHLDCFDSAIEQEFGMKMYNLLLLESSKAEMKTIPNWIEKIIKEGVEMGKRHVTRFKLMVTLRALGFDNETIKEKIKEFNSNCRPPEHESIVDYHINYFLRRLK